LHHAAVDQFLDLSTSARSLIPAGLAPASPSSPCCRGSVLGLVHQRAVLDPSRARTREPVFTMLPWISSWTCPPARRPLSTASSRGAWRQLARSGGRRIWRASP